MNWKRKLFNENIFKAQVESFETLPPLKQPLFKGSLKLSLPAQPQTPAPKNEECYCLSPLKNHHTFSFHHKPGIHHHSLTKTL
jgi:hypothetical protein